MSQFPSVQRRVLSAFLLGLGACGLASTAQTPQPQTPPVPPSPAAFVVQLAGANVVPPVDTIANGVAELSLSADGQTLNWRISHTGLSGPATSANFHGPAMARQNAGIVVPISGSLISPVSGTVSLAPWQVADLLDGKWYLNINSAAHPNGEIRGQVLPRS